MGQMRFRPTVAAIIFVVGAIIVTQPLNRFLSTHPAISLGVSLEWALLFLVAAVVVVRGAVAGLRVGWRTSFRQVSFACLNLSWVAALVAWAFGPSQPFAVVAAVVPQAVSRGIFFAALAVMLAPVGLLIVANRVATKEGWYTPPPAGEAARSLRQMLTVVGVAIALTAAIVAGTFLWVLAH